MRLPIKWPLLAGLGIALSWLVLTVFVVMRSRPSAFELCSLAYAVVVVLWIMYAGAKSNSERKRLVESLAQAASERDRLRLELDDVFCRLPIPLAWTEEDGRLARLNRYFEQLLGYRTGDCVGHNIGEFFGNMPLGLDIIERLSSGETVENLPISLKCKDGSQKDVLLDSDSPGCRTSLTRCSFRDISDQQNSLLARQEVEELFAHFAHYLNCFVWVSSLDFSRMFYVSDTYTRLFRRSCESLYNRPDSLLDAVHPDDRSRVFTAVLRMQLSGCLDEEFRIVYQDGATAWMHAQGFPVRDGEGAIRKICGFVIDISERKHARLLSEAQHAVTSILDSAVTVHQAAYDVLSVLSETSGWQLGALWSVDRKSNVLRCACAWEEPGLTGEDEDSAISRDLILVSGRGLPGVAWDTGEPIWISDLKSDSRFPGAGHIRLEDMHGALAYPILVNGKINAVIELYRRAIQPVDPGFLALLDVAGSQLAHFIELKANENFALASELRLHLSMESLTEHSVVMLDPMGIVTEWSAGAERLLGYEKQEIVGRHVACLYPTEFSQSCLATLKVAETTGRHECEGWLVSKNGCQVWANVATCVMRDEHGLLCGFSILASQRLGNRWEEAHDRQLVSPGPKQKKSKGRR